MMFLGENVMHLGYILVVLIKKHQKSLFFIILCVILSLISLKEINYDT